MGMTAGRGSVLSAALIACLLAVAYQQYQLQLFLRLPFQLLPTLPSQPQSRCQSKTAEDNTNSHTSEFDTGRFGGADCIACVHVVTTTIHSSSSTNTSNLSQTSGNQVVDTDTDTYTYGACVVTEDTPPLERLEQRTALEVSIVGERYSELS